MDELIVKVLKYLLEVSVSLEQLLNTLIGGFSDESFSARVYKNREFSRSWYRTYCIINLIFFFQKDHCKLFYVYEQRRLGIEEDY